MTFAKELDELVAKHLELGIEDLSNIISDMELKMMALAEEEEEGE